MDVASLDRAVQEYFHEALASSTKRSYGSAQRRFLAFCSRSKLSPLAVSEEMLCRYVAFLAEDGLAHSTIKSYLSAVRQLQIAEGLPDPFLASMPRLEQEIKGIKVRQGKQGRKPRKKLPITPAILHKMRLAWETEADDPDLIMLWAACTLCFFGFHRSGEIAIPAENAFDPTYHLAFEDLAVDSQDQPSYHTCRCP